MTGARRFELLGALVAAAVALVPGGPGWARAAALALVLGVLPGWIAARHLLPRADATARAMLGIALSPLLTAAPAALLALRGAGGHPVVGVTASARLVILAIAALAAWDGTRGKPAAEGARAAAPGSAGLTPWGVALGGTALAAAFHAANPALAWRSDGPFHAAVTLAVARGGVPPEDPWFAGLRLLYGWGPHAWASMWLAISPALAVWTPLVILDLLAAFAGLLGVCLLARRLGGGASAQWLAAALAAFGAAPFAWGWIVARALAGEARGLAELRRLVESGVDPALLSMSPRLLHPSLVFAADKFMVLTPFSLGLATLPAFALALVESLERPGARSAIGLALIAAAALFVHPVVGAALLGCGATAMAWVALRGAPWRGPAGAGLALGLALLAALPYLAAITAGRQSPAGAGLSWRALETLIAGGALLVPAGLAGLWRGTRSAAHVALAARVVLAAALALAVAGSLLRLAGDNQSKLLNLLFLLLSAPAALAWLALHERLGPRPRAILVGGLALATLPTAAVCGWAYACERAQAPEAYRPPAPGERAVLAWARDSLPAGAVLVDPAVDRGAGATLAVATRRSLLWGGEALARKWGYAPPALELRRRAAAELAAGGPLSPAVADFARDLGRGIVVVERPAPGETAAGFARRASRVRARLHPMAADSALALERYEVDRR